MTYFILPKRLPLQIDNAAPRPIILSEPLRDAATVGFGGIFARRRRGQVGVCDLFGHLQ